MAVTKGVEKLIGEYQGWYEQRAAKETEEVIAVDEVIAKVASFYERIRGIVDWREEHLLRKTAIERILKRRISVSKFDEDFAENFLSELVRGGHFPNKRITYEKADEIQGILEKYVFLFGATNDKNLQDWLFSVAAVETEEALSLPIRERALIDLMTNDLVERIEVRARKNQQVTFSSEEKILQVFVAVQRALYKLDNATITFHILERFYPDWANPSQHTLEYVGSNLPLLYENIQKILKHSFSEKFYQLAEKHDTPYLLLHDILSADPNRFADELLEKPEQLEENIRQAYNRRHDRLRGKLQRAAFYSTLSVFLTKVSLAVFMEIPLERYFGAEFNPLAIGMSITVPPLLMAVLVMSVQTNSKENFERVTIEVMKIIRSRQEGNPYVLSIPKPRSGAIVFLIYAFYGLTFLLSFGLASFLLGKLNFSLFSIFVFLLFLSLVLFGATKIRQRARELMIEPEKENLLRNMFDIFSLPMIQVGGWLSGKIARYNILILVFNFLIEVPFQMFVEFLDQWRSFLREKKEEIH